MDIKTIKEKRYAIKGNKANRLTVSVYYSKGGMNYFTGKIEPRGYYFSITPEMVENGMVSYESFSGSKTLMFEASRRTKKGESKATELLEDYSKRYLGNWMTHYGYSFDKERGDEK